MSHRNDRCRDNSVGLLWSSVLVGIGSAAGCSSDYTVRPTVSAASMTAPAVPAPLGPVLQIDAGVLNVGYVETGPANGKAVVLLHGWPYDIHCFDAVAPLLAAKGYRVVVPYLRGFGTTHFRSAETPRSGEQAAMAADTIALMDALRINKAILAGFDWGARTVDSVAALWPERTSAIVSVSGYLIVNLKANAKPLPPAAEVAWWYQYYFATERGRTGYDENRRAFAKLIWKQASPKWRFDDTTFDRSAGAFDNPDHVSIVIDNYRWRLGISAPDPQYAELESRLQQAPVISVPAITMASDFDGAAADGASYAKQFSGRHDHRVLPGIGHDVPQEAPEAFAQAIVDVGNY
jgi:pimeloyl-ACP methyl ester carboxylesterase